MMFSHSSKISLNNVSHMMLVMLMFKNKNLCCCEISIIKLSNVVYYRFLTFIHGKLLKFKMAPGHLEYPVFMPITLGTVHSCVQLP